MGFSKSFAIIAVLVIALIGGCVQYSFTGTSIPSDVRTIYISFFPDNSQSGLGDLTDRINQALVNRFVNQSRLSLTSNEDSADSTLEGAIQTYTNRPFSIGGDQQANINEIQIVVRAEFRFAKDDEPIYSKTFTGSGTYNVQEDPVDGEIAAAEEALQEIAESAFNDAVSTW